MSNLRLPITPARDPLDLTTAGLRHVAGRAYQSGRHLYRMAGETQLY